MAGREGNMYMAGYEDEAELDRFAEGFRLNGAEVNSCNQFFHRGIYPYWHIYLWQNGFVYQKGRIRLAFRWD